MITTFFEWRGHAPSVDIATINPRISDTEVSNSRFFTDPRNRTNRLEKFRYTVVDGPQTVVGSRSANLLSNCRLFDRVAATRNQVPPYPTPLFISGLGERMRAKQSVEVVLLSKNYGLKGHNGIDCLDPGLILLRERYGMLLRNYFVLTVKGRVLCRNMFS